MSKSIPTQIKNLDIETADRVLCSYLREAYLEHPTRGPFVSSRQLYEALAGEIDERFTRQFFGMFCESRPYLEQWTRGHGGSYQYRILPAELGPSPDLDEDE